MRNPRTGDFLSPVRIFCRPMAAALAIAVAAVPFAGVSPAQAQAAPAAIASGQSVDAFYAARGGQPLWLSAESGNAARLLMSHLGDSRLDGLDPNTYLTRDLMRTVQSAWGGKPAAVQRADRMLSQAFVRYANDLKAKQTPGIYYVDPELAPRAKPARTWLEEAAAAPSLERYANDMGWMNPVYTELRQALVDRRYAGESQRRLILLNMERARALPGGHGRYVVVNSAAQRLYMYDRGEVVDSMRVVVGQPKHATPMMAANIRFASLNPYWNVPPDLAAERIAPNVVKDGLGYLRARGYQVLSDWSEDATIVDPTTVDWQGVADGSVEIRIRQLPGPSNSMGRMKFMFPNREGIYLHDTPDKELLSEASRLFSGGCVRLEDASRLGEWLFGRSLEARGASPEQKVELDRPVPVFITYLTAVPSGSSIAWFDDIYGRDSARLAASDGRLLAR
jgi:L,D-transpeptidase YcbB